MRAVCIQRRMSLPTSPIDEHLPKGPNFLAIVIAFAIAILVVLVVAWFVVGHRGKKMFPMKTRETPSQTLLHARPESTRVTGIVVA